MKTWTWVLLFAVAVLFLWSIRREGFQDTASLHGPPYGGCVKNSQGTCVGADDYTVIAGMMPPTLVTVLETENGATKPEPPTNPSAADTARYNEELLAYHRKLVEGKISDLMGDFHTTVYQPASGPISATDVDTFLNTHSGPPFIASNKPDLKSLLVAYFVTQTHGAPNVPLTAAQLASSLQSTLSGYAATLADVGQGVAPPPTCPTGYTLSADKKKCTGSTPTDTKDPTCATGFTYSAGECTRTTPVTGGTGGGTTGGSSTFTTSNSGGNKGNIWGPAYSGMGNNAGSGSSGGTRDYPTLIGPKPRESSMVEGAGIMNPSQHQTLVSSGASGKGSLPTAAGTGSDPNSRFFGSSRVPGDQDLFPDTYQEFTPSTGSSKTEPVPYLSDFSAFFN